MQGPRFVNSIYGIKTTYFTEINKVKKTKQTLKYILSTFKLHVVVQKQKLTFVCFFQIAGIDIITLIFVIYTKLHSRLQQF